MNCQFMFRIYTACVNFLKEFIYLRISLNKVYNFVPNCRAAAAAAAAPSKHFPNSSRIFNAGGDTKKKIHKN